MLATFFLVLAFILLTGACIYPLAFRHGMKLGVTLTLQQVDAELDRLEALKQVRQQGGLDVH